MPTRLTAVPNGPRVNSRDSEAVALAATIKKNFEELGVWVIPLPDKVQPPIGYD